MTIFGLPRSTEAAAGWASHHGVTLPRGATAQMQVKTEMSEFKRHQCEARALSQVKARHTAAAKPLAGAKPASADRRAWHLAERQRLDGVMAAGRADLRRANEKLVQEHERAARATARNEATRKTFEGTPLSRAAARTEIAIAHEVERKRLDYLEAEARAFARKF